MLLPAAERRGDICFVVAKSLPYTFRLLLALTLIAIGFVLQAVMLSGGNWFIGLAPIFCGILLLLTKGYTNVIDSSAAEGDWRTASRENIERILTIANKQRSWDQDLIDITCGTGFLGFLVVLILLGGSFLYVSNYSVSLAFVLLADAAVMIVPFWVTGVRSILKNDRLLTKCKILINLENALNAQALKGASFRYQTMMVKSVQEGKDVTESPRDVKAMVAFANAPDTFLGLQIQIAINSIQGADFPYCYCVILFRPDFLGGKDFFLPEMEGIILERELKDDVCVIVVRQDTTASAKGYYTNDTACSSLFDCALGQTQFLLDRFGKAAS